MTPTLREGKAKMKCYWTLVVRGADCSRRPIFNFFVLKKNGFAPWHYAQSNINILLTKNLPIDSGVRQ